MKIIINVLNEEVLDKLMWLLDHFKNDGIEIIKSEGFKEHKWDDEYVEKHWREIGMNTHSAGLDDDEELYEAAWEFYNEKYTD